MMGSWSEWFKFARQKNVNIEFLKFNANKEIALLGEIGVPYFDYIIFDGAKFETDKEQLIAFSNKYDLLWTRIPNKSNVGERYYKVGIKDYKELFSFIESLDIDISKFSIQLFENCENKFGGNIISNGDDATLELIEGTQDEVGKSLRPFFHALTNNHGSLRFVESNVSKDMRAAANQVLKYIRIGRNNYIKGYFEFIVSPEHKVYFIYFKPEVL